eukprot:gene1695-2040_t
MPSHSLLLLLLLLLSVQRFNADSLEFLGKMLERSGLGNDTCTPPWLTNEPISMDIAHARLEFEIMCFGPIQELLNKTASLVAIDLARQVLQSMPDTYVLVVSHENITNNWRAKYELRHLVRVNLAGQDTAYRCVYQMEDDNGELGVRLSKDLTQVAASALQKNMVNLGPLVLPFSEKFLFAVNLLQRKLNQGKKVPAYVPDFSLAFEHICIHSGGRAVIDGMQQHLGLSDEAIEPSRAGLYRWGNVSSASVWYVLSYIETFRGVQKGDKVWQLSFGSGFKCNSAVWTALRPFKDQHSCWSGFSRQQMVDDLGKLNAVLEAEKAAKRSGAASNGGAKVWEFGNLLEITRVLE